MSVNYHGIVWEDCEIPVYVPGEGGVWYPRMFSDNGRLYCAFDLKIRGQNAVIAMVHSDDGGLTWSREPVSVSRVPDRNCANAAFAVTGNEMLIAYRAVLHEGSRVRTGLYVSSSVDRADWKYHSTIIEEDNEGFFGVWEPHFGFIDGKLAVFYANDSRSVVPEPSMQNIEYKIWDETVRSWSEAHVVCNGKESHSRDGMPVWCSFEGAGYLLAIEATSNQPFNPFVIKLLSASAEGRWFASGTVYQSEKEGRKAGAPYILRLPDNRIALSFQTDEDSSKAGDAYSVMKFAVSDFVIEDNVPVRDDFCCADFEKPFVPFDTPDGFNSNWNCLHLDGNILFACTSTNYPRSMIKIRRAEV